ncbi:MAG: hypothetical protein PHG00_07855 [Methylococcales bacterium]|nr:hypothetical protein [Methylococcales bacterium]
MNGKNLSNPFSTGGGGPHFEAHVQASFVALMLTSGFAPCLPCYPITKIQLQAKFAEYGTDDLIVFVESSDSGQEHKMFGQIKHSISITEKDKMFGEVIQAAWNDFNNTSLFTRNSDVVALITGPLSATDIGDVRTILEWQGTRQYCMNLSTPNPGLLPWIAIQRGRQYWIWCALGNRTDVF